MMASSKVEAYADKTLGGREFNADGNAGPRGVGQLAIHKINRAANHLLTSMLPTSYNAPHTRATTSQVVNDRE